MDFNFYMNFLAAMLAIINPLGIWPVWSELTDDIRRKKVRKSLSIMLVLTAFMILTVFLISGKYLLDFFSIDIPVFKIAGGILLLYTGISMIEGSATKLAERHEVEETDMALAKARFRKVIVPLAIPMLAGPGSITTVILYGISAGSVIDFVVLTLIVLFTLFLLWVVFISSYFLENKVDKTVFTIFTRIFGIIVTAIAIQFIVEGLAVVFPGLVN